MGTYTDDDYDPTLHERRALGVKIIVLWLIVLVLALLGLIQSCRGDVQVAGLACSGSHPDVRGFDSHRRYQVRSAEYRLPMWRHEENRRRG